jgi:hypothetical protein
VPARPAKYEAAAAPKGSRRPAPAAGAARGEGAGAERACAEGARDEGAVEVTFSRASADGSFVPAGVPGVRAGLPEPVAASPATVPAAMAAQAPSATSTTRMGARGGLAPERLEPACLPFVPETDVLTTIPIVNLASVRPGGPGRKAAKP